jgi:DNA modification methylase
MTVTLHHRDFIGIEREGEYLDIARARIAIMDLHGLQLGAA